MPTIIPPTNITPETAYDLNGRLPLDATIDLTGMAWPQKVWFRYTLGTLEYGLAIYAKGGGSTPPNHGYYPKLEFMLNDPLATPFQDASGNYVVEMFTEASVGVPNVGSTVFISMHNGYPSGYIPLIITTIKAELSPNTAVPIGSPIINNDVEGYPVTIVDPVTGLPVQLRSFVTGETGAILENGISLWYSSFDRKYHLYNANMEPTGIITWLPNNGTFSPVGSNRIDTFYVASYNGTESATNKITTISSSGVLSSTFWQITNINTALTNIGYRHVAPSYLNPDILFLNIELSLSSMWPPYHGICKFHKSTQIVDTVFIDGTTDPNYSFEGQFGNEFLVLPDDSLLLMFIGNFSATGSQVRHYSAAGVLLRTYDIPNADIDHIAYDGVTYTSFWSWGIDYTTSFGIFTRFRISDGAILSQFSLIPTSSGAGFASAPPTSATLFGGPESCTFVTSATPLSRYGGVLAPTEISGIYFINHTKATKHDSYYNNIEKKIPNPTIRTALIGE